MSANIKGEVLLWQQTVRALPKELSGPLDALQHCNRNLFPTVHRLLTIMATLPVTTCSCERSFSSLKYLKNYLRSTTGEERLNGLAMAFIHDFDISPDEVLDNLATKKERRLQFRLR